MKSNGSNIKPSPTKITPRSEAGKVGINEKADVSAPAKVDRARENSPVQKVDKSQPVKSTESY